MSATATDEHTATWAEMLEEWERKRSGQNKIVVRENVARHVGVLPGTLQSLSRRRLKGVKAWVSERIRAAVIRELEREILRLQHELEIARQGGARMDSNEVQQAFSALHSARTLIKQAAA